MTRENEQHKLNETIQHYRSLNSFLREQFGEKVYKLALDGGFTCPTRDGSKGTGGCTFCAGGSGDFAIPVGDNVSEPMRRSNGFGTSTPKLSGTRTLRLYPSGRGRTASTTR